MLWALRAFSYCQCLTCCKMSDGLHLYILTSTDLQVGLKRNGVEEWKKRVWEIKNDFVGNFP